MTIHNPALIRFIAGRYRDLQGLSTVADAALLLLPAAGLYLNSLGWTKASVGVLMVMAAYGWARFTRVRRWIDAFYTSRCGRVHWSLAFPFAFPLYMQGALLAPELLDIGVPAPLRTAFVLVLLAGLPVRIAGRDWPYRAHWLLPAAVGVVAAATFAGVTTHEQARAWVPPALFACGTSLALAGLLDHSLLLKTLHDRSNPTEGAPVQAP